MSDSASAFANTPVDFIADLHLSPRTPEIHRRFLRYLDAEARQAGQLFILGDLFEAWPGDDLLDDPDDHGFAAGIAAALRRLSDAGVALSLMHGNRDFLLGDAFAARCGARLLPDPFALTLSTAPDATATSPSEFRLILSHGDALCTNDREYQAVRARLRQPAVQAAMLARPLAERKAMAAEFRRQSEHAWQEKIRQGRHGDGDLAPETTDNFLREHGYATFIHGHTHLPATHTHLIDGRTVERWVLADWRKDSGEALRFDGRQLRRMAL